jgi:cytochrome d ubiquinol oxidase subunit II
VETLWFVLVGFMLTMYVLLDGFDLGAGAIHPFVAKTDEERRTVVEAIGPVWDGNEVWLIAAGGTLFFTFPRLYAASFSGFYLPLMVVLWLLMARGVAIELRSRGNAVWSTFWDTLSAIANVVRGVPLNADGYFFEPLWTDFDPRSPTPGILDWYTIVIGLLGLAALVLHGASFIAVRTDGPVQARSQRLAYRSWLAVAVLTVLGTATTFFVRPALLGGFGERPLGGVLPVVALAGLALAGVACRRNRDDWRFIGSALYLAGMLASSAFVIYPNVLPAVDPANSLTIVNAASPQYGLLVGLAWWSIGMVLAAIYFVMVYRLFWGKVTLGDSHY